MFGSRLSSGVKRLPVPQSYLQRQSTARLTTYMAGSLPYPTLSGTHGTFFDNFEYHVRVSRFLGWAFQKDHSKVSLPEPLHQLHSLD